DPSRPPLGVSRFIFPSPLVGEGGSSCEASENRVRGKSNYSRALALANPSPTSLTFVRSVPLPQGERGKTSSDFPPCVLPIGIAQLALENLSRILARQACADLDCPWHFVIRQSRGKLGANFADVDARPVRRLDHRHQRLAILVIRHAEYSAVG